MKYEEKYYLYLDSLRESGATNMFGAVPFLREVFPELTKREAQNILVDWMETFEERQKENKKEE